MLPSPQLVPFGLAFLRLRRNPTWSRGKIAPAPARADQSSSETQASTCHSFILMFSALFIYLVFHLLASWEDLCVSSQDTWKVDKSTRSLSTPEVFHSCLKPPPRAKTWSYCSSSLWMDICFIVLSLNSSCLFFLWNKSYPSASIGSEHKTLKLTSSSKQVIEYLHFLSNASKILTSS